MHPLNKWMPVSAKEKKRSSTGIIFTISRYSGRHLAAEADSFFPYKNDSGASAA